MHSGAKPRSNRIFPPIPVEIGDSMDVLYFRVPSIRVNGFLGIDELSGQECGIGRLVAQRLGKFNDIPEDFFTGLPCIDYSNSLQWRHLLRS